MSDIESFVKDELGKAVLSNLKRIYVGGNNNKKGRDYENFFQLFKAFELASQDIDHEKHLLSGEFKHEVRQFEKSYDNQQAEQISLMV